VQGFAAAALLGDDDSCDQRLGDAPAARRRGDGHRAQQRRIAMAFDTGAAEQVAVALSFLFVAPNGHEEVLQVRLSAVQRQGAFAE
jgi:hypothetical protein